MGLHKFDKLGDDATECQGVPRSARFLCVRLCVSSGFRNPWQLGYLSVEPERRNIRVDVSSQVWVGMAEDCMRPAGL